MKVKRSPLVLLLLLIAGAILGSAIWSLLTPVLPSALTKSFTVGSTGGPWNLDLVFVALTIGIVLSVNIGSLLGLIIAVVIFYNL